MIKGDVMMRVILNADDFGLSHTINESIAIAYDQGVLTSTTLLVFREATVEAVEYARARPNLGIGIHLDLDKFFDFEVNGHFGVTIEDIDQDVYEYYTTQKTDELRREIYRQLEQFQKFGLLPTHLDGHHNIHMFPQVLPYVVEAMQRYGLGRMRFSSKFFANQFRAYSTCQIFLDKANIKYPDHCLDLNDELPMGTILGRVKTGVTEIVVHTDLPGNDENDWRIRQFLYVTSAAATKVLEVNGIECITYSDL